MFGNGHKIRKIRPKRRGRLRWEGFVEKVSFESGVELRWIQIQIQFIELVARRLMRSDDNDDGLVRER